MGKAAAPFPRCPQALVSQILSGCSGPQDQTGSVPPWGLGRGSPVPQPPPPGTVALGVLRQDQSPALVAMERAVRVLGRAAKSPKKSTFGLISALRNRCPPPAPFPAHPGVPARGGTLQPGACRPILVALVGHWWGTGGTGGAQGLRPPGGATTTPPPPGSAPAPVAMETRRGLARPGPAGGGRGRPRARCPVPGALPAHPVLPGPAVWCPRPAPVPP